MQYGDKRDYPKIDLFDSAGKYLGTTTWVKNCKEAATRYVEKYGLAAGSIKAFKQ